jgi:hypothetical protein
LAPGEAARPGVVPQPLADTTDRPERVIRANSTPRRVEDLSGLTPRGREALYFSALGFRCDEMRPTDAGYTAVSRVSARAARPHTFARDRQR